MPVPYGQRSLLVACHGPRDPQFEGLGRLLRVLSRQHACHLSSWDGLPLDLSGRRVLARVLISGHGSDSAARFAAAGTPPLEPWCLRLPGHCRLYLLGCSQGTGPFRQLWAKGTGVACGQVAGSPGETETAISTCLLLHLVEDGLESIDRWFPLWVRCNEALRPHFPEIRRTYDRHGADPVAAFRAMETRTDPVRPDRVRLDLAPFAEFLSVIERHPEYLRGLPSVGREIRRPG